MNNLIISLLKGVNFFTLLNLLYRAGGKSAVERFLTVPEAAIKKLPTAAGPGRLAVILGERNEFVEEAIEFFEACTDEDFADPDIEDAQD